MLHYFSGEINSFFSIWKFLVEKYAVSTTMIKFLAPRKKKINEAVEKLTLYSDMKRKETLWF